MCCHRINLHCVICLTAAKPVMDTGPEDKTIIMEPNNNITLTCGVQYAYPAPKIEWKITIPSSGLNIVQQNTSGSSSYKLYDNRSIEIYHKSMLEEGHVIVTCLATNNYGSSKAVFQLWDHYTFIKSMYSMYNMATYIKITDSVTTYNTVKQHNVYSNCGQRVTKI